jgi:hydroxymethylglutaryl-CoA lyase
MSQPITLVECPRDAWQGMSKQIPTHVKASYLRALIDAGFRHIDAVSFVSPKAVPQMADSEQVLSELGPIQNAEIIGIVMNRKGVERAIATGAVNTVGFPYSVSPTFAMRNQRQSPEQSFAELSEIRKLAESSGLAAIAYLSMAFGNPYGDSWSPRELSDAVGRVRDTGVRVASLADTVGCAQPQQLQDIVGEVIGQFPDLEVGVHLHGRPESAGELVSAAYAAGCRRFDSVIGGFGGCPFAQDQRTGNIPTEQVLRSLDMPEILTGESFGRLLAHSREIAETYE